MAVRRQAFRWQPEEHWHLERENWPRGVLLLFIEDKLRESDSAILCFTYLVHVHQANEFATLQLFADCKIEPRSS